MKRLLYNQLVEWKNDADRKPLVLEGARQVGKTWLLKEFGKNEYHNMIYVNFHDDPDAQVIFQQNLKVDRIIESLETISHQKITAGKTLIFLDEIQEAFRGLDSLKYFCEDAREQHVAVAGSLLGTTHRKGESYPVGKVNLLTLYPMTFEEFLWAKGEDRLADVLMQTDWEMAKVLDSRLQELLRQYYFVGGMPEAVLQYTTKGDVNKVRKIHHEILKTYDNDFAKHAGDETERVRMVWESIPAQLAKENKKFIYGAVKAGSRARDFEVAIQWLVNAGLVYKIHRCKAPVMPLKFYEDFDAFKLYLLDVGLLGALSEASPRFMLITNDVFKGFKGAFTENYVLEQLKAMQDLPVYYFSKENSPLEVDFMVQTEDRVIPLEVKAEVNVKSKSLRQFVTIDHADKQLKGLRCSMLPYMDQGWMENVPLYGIEGYVKSQFGDGV